VITNESDLRELLARVDTSDLAPPEIAAIRGRARRHRAAQIGTALGSAAAIAAIVVATFALTRATPSALSPADVSRTKVNLHDGVSAPQWLVARQTIDGETYVAVASRSLGQTCVHTSDGGEHCDPRSWPGDTVADYGSESSGQIIEVVGRVPITARSVTVQVDNRAVRTVAMLTPASNHERFFAAWLKLPASYNPVQPVVGVLDADGKPVPPPGGGRPISMAGSHSSVSGLPNNQLQIVQSSAGWQVVTFRRNGRVCLQIIGAHETRRSAARCGPFHSATAQVDAQISLGDVHVLAGDAPPGTTAVVVATGQSYQDGTAIGLPGTGGRVAWVTSLAKGTMGGPWTIATCSAGLNCWNVKPIVFPTVRTF